MHLKEKWVFLLWVPFSMGYQKERYHSIFSVTVGRIFWVISILSFVFISNKCLDSATKCEAKITIISTYESFQSIFFQWPFN